MTCIVITDTMSYIVSDDTTVKTNELTPDVYEKIKELLDVR